MPRFSPNRWKPSDDSPPGCKTLDPRCVVLYRPWFGDTMACPCGCGDTPTGSKSTFRMGHDARLRGVLIRAHLMGVQVRYCRTVEGTMTEPCHAEELAADYDWVPYLESAVLRREGKNREVLKRALGSERLVRVGRWDYTGQVVAVYRVDREDRFEIEYVDKAGNVRRTRVPATEAPLAQGEAA